MAKIGIMGGTFDPIHYGHLMLGRQAYEEYGLYEVWYMPSGQPPHKRGQDVAPARDRCSMTALAVAGRPGMRLSEFEVRREGTTYTAETLALLRREFPQHEFYFIVGADSLYEMENWYHPDEVLTRTNVLAADREYENACRPLDEQIAYLNERYHARISRLHCRELDISSEEIRRRARGGGSLKGLVPDRVEEYIRKHHLYQEAGPMERSIIELRKKLKKKLNEDRYEHTLSVSFTCVCLAMRYGYPLDKAEIAGLLHDCAKCYDDETYIERCEKHGIPVSEAEREAPGLLHAKLGAWIARERYGIDDPELLGAIACHTTGKPEMGLLDKILYVADYIEVRRSRAENLTEMRRLAFQDLDEAVYQILKGTLAYLEEKGGAIDPMTRRTYEYMDALRNGQDTRG